MFYYLRGAVAHMESYLAVIDCGGVGYACHTTNNTLYKLRKGETATLYTHCYIREDSFDIYGFSSMEELSCFRMLIGVSGVGPKAALSILSSSTPEGVAMAIISGDEKMLTVAQGIGKKIAQRIILELKDKIAKEQLDGGTFGVPSGGFAGKVSEAAAALAVLGYSQSDISAAVKGIDAENLAVEEIIRQALKQMVK